MNQVRFKETSSSSLRKGSARHRSLKETDSVDARENALQTLDGPTIECVFSIERGGVYTSIKGKTREYLSLESE